MGLSFVVKLIALYWGNKLLLLFFFFTSLFWFSVVSGCDFLLFLFPSYFLPCAISPCFLFFSCCGSVRVENINSTSLMSS